MLIKPYLMQTALVTGHPHANQITLMGLQAS